MGTCEDIVLSILKFLCHELDSPRLTEDSRESIEVAVQCLESAYSVSKTQSEGRDVLNLDQLFYRFYFDDFSEDRSLTTSDSEKAEAENFKTSGNSAMKEENFLKAIEFYTSAIRLDPVNAIYYCNRAAAYTRLNQHEIAIQDCKTAIRLDPKYSKAYGRLGFSYSSLNLHEFARRSYVRAIELEPDNESYKNNLKLATESLVRGGSGSRPPPPAPGPTAATTTPQIPGLPPNMDLNSLVNNPVLMNMASQMLTNPNMQNLMSGLMSMGTGDTNVDALIQAGQQLAQQMQTANPELVENIRRHVASPEQDSPQEPEQNPPQSPPTDP